MGKASRWFKGLFGIKTANKDPIPGKMKVARSQHADGERERNKHAIAVATATAAAADAAVAAAHAAAAGARLTCQDRNRYNTKLIAGALTIQTNFRRYLARKALRALKGVVKIQALVRGYLVRKQAAATLHGIEALFRAQATVRSRRATSGLKTCPSRPNPRPSMCEFGSGIEIGQYYNLSVPSVRSRRMSASFEARTPDHLDDQGRDTSKVVEVDVGQPGSNSGRSGTDPSSYQVLPSQFQLHFQSHSHFVPCHHNSFNRKQWSLASPHTSSRLSNLGCGPGADMLQQLYYHYPNNMANPMSIKAKVRAQSAPKQRPEPNQKRSGVSERKTGMSMEGWNSTSVSRVRMQRSSSHVQEEAFSFKNVVMDKIGKFPLLH